MSTPTPRPARPVTRLIVRMTSGAAPTTQVRTVAASLAGVRAASDLRRTASGATLVGLSSPVSADEAWRVARALTARSDVAYAEPDLWVYPTSTAPHAPTDPLYAAHQWDLWDSASPTGGFATHATAAWSRTRGRAGVVVAVIDTGLTAHADLTASVTKPAATDPIVPGYDFVSDTRIANDGSGRDSNPSDPGDWVTAAESQSGFFQDCPVEPSSWHGTHVTGTIVAKSSNGIGISGIAPGVKVQPVRALGKCGGDISDINDAIEWASGGTVAGVPANATPASVINLSLGGPGACLQSTQDAIDHARSRGTTVVVAAGNGDATGKGVSIAPSSPTSTTTGSQPADCSGVIPVAAIDRAGRLSTFSNFGTPAFPVTIAAPGGDLSGTNDIWSTVNTGTQGPVSSGYAPYAGTSMAAPHVAAAVALLQSSAVGRTAYTPDQVAAVLPSLTQPFPAKAFRNGACTAAVCGAGILDLAGTLPTLAPLAPAVRGDVRPQSVALSWTPGDSGGLPVTYTVEQSEDGTSFHPTSPAITGIGATSATVTGLGDTLAPFWFRVVAQNDRGSSAPSPAAGPFRTAPYLVQSVAVAGHIEHLAVSWRKALATDVSSYTLRFRRVGTTAWTYRSAPATVTTITVTTWPRVMPAGRYELQIGALHPGVASPSTWTAAPPVTVWSLRQRAVESATTLRPYVDGVQDSIRFVASSNVRTSGVVRILTSSGRLVRSVTLARTTGWSVVWTGRDAHGRLVPGGTYRADVRLIGRTPVPTRIALLTFSVVRGRA